MSNDSPDELQRALDGDETARSRLIDSWTSIIHCRVARELVRGRDRKALGREIRQEVEDRVQDVFLHLFKDDGGVLRSWQPERGLSLENFIGMVAERRTRSILRSGRRSPWRDDPTPIEHLDEPSVGNGPEDVTASRETLRLLWERLREEVSPLGLQMFDVLFIQERSTEEAVERTGLSVDAVYAWRSRLRRLARRLLQELSEHDPPPRRTTVRQRP